MADSAKDADELERIINTLTPEQESKLREVHMAQYTGLDDDSVDDYEKWLMNLSLGEIRKII